MSIAGFRRRDPGGVLARKMATARAMPPVDVALVALCWTMLGASSLLVAILPTRRVLRWLGRNAGATGRAPAAGPRDLARAGRIAHAVAVAARNAPFRADCYPQALTAARLCRWLSVPHSVHLGARFAAAGGDAASKLEGHAWVRSGTTTICGGANSAGAFGTVACFVHLPRRSRADAVG